MTYKTIMKWAELNLDGLYKLSINIIAPHAFMLQKHFDVASKCMLCNISGGHYPLDGVRGHANT